MTAAASIDADYEAALSQLAGLIGVEVLILHLVAGSVIGGASGTLEDAIPLRPGAADESVVFRLLPAATFCLDRSTFRSWKLHLGETGVDAVDVELEGGAAVTITRIDALT